MPIYKVNATINHKGYCKRIASKIIQKFAFDVASIDEALVLAKEEIIKRFRYSSLLQVSMSGYTTNAQGKIEDTGNLNFEHTRSKEECLKYEYELMLSNYNENDGFNRISSEEYLENKFSKADLKLLAKLGLYVGNKK